MSENEIFEKWLLVKWIPTKENYIYGIDDAWGIGGYYDTQEEAKDAMMAEIDTHEHFSACDIDEFGSFYGYLYVERTKDGIYALYFIKCCSDEVRQMQVECENYRNEIAMLRSAIDAKDKQINYRDVCIKKQRSMLKKYKDRLDAIDSERSETEYHKPFFAVAFDDLRFYCEKWHCGSVPLEYIKQMPQFVVNSERSEKDEIEYLKETIKRKENRIDELMLQNQELGKIIDLRNKTLDTIRDVVYPF